VLTHDEPRVGEELVRAGQLDEELPRLRLGVVELGLVERRADDVRGTNEVAANGATSTSR
jgi:hypothetical protein